jgi:hypothetical protein
VKLSDYCTLVVLGWGLAALAWPQPQPPQQAPQRLASPISAVQPAPQPIPDRSTLTAFPGP